jgi:ribonuclease G
MAHNTLLINVDIGETRVGLIEEGILAELYVERTRERSPVGNIYLGKVTRVLPGMQAAFVDIGLDRAAFLHVEDVIPADDFEQFISGEPDSEEREDETTVTRGRRLTRRTPIRDVLKEGQVIVVQVSKEPIGTKGARVTGHISLPGRYVVYMPTVDQLGVSKRIGNERERRRLREAIESLKPPQGGLIVRTVANGLTKKKLKADVGYLVNVWAETLKRREQVKEAPAPVYQELDIILRAGRDLFTDEVERIIIDDPKEYERLVAFIESFMPERLQNIELYRGSDPIFDEYGIEDEISRALARKVPLPSGGYLIIDQAEALTAIDVNTGRFTGKGKDVEETIFQTNVEAVKEIAYQLRFRNIGGLIVLDFIDMERASHRERVYKAFLEVLKHDKAKTTAVRISELGLIEMTRKRTRESLGRTLYEPCFYCDGTGHLQSKATICHEILRQISREHNSLPGYKIVVNAHPAVCDMMQREAKELVEEASMRFTRQIVVQPRRDYHLEQFDLHGA